MPDAETSDERRDSMGNVVLLDGAVGTSLWELAEAQGIAKDPVWKYNIEHPELVLELHRRMIDAGAQMILTNTIGANGPMVERSSNYELAEVITRAVELTKKAVEGTGVKAAFACGPLSELMEPYGDLEEEEVERLYTEMMEPAAAVGVDAIMLQTFIDLEMMKVAARCAKKYNVPVYCTLSFEKVGKTMMGQSVEDVCRGLEETGVDGIGMNCSLGPEYAVPIIREFSEKTKLPLVFKPNAGMPGHTDSPERFAELIRPALDYVSFIGGCCNCNWDYVKAIKKIMEE